MGKISRRKFGARRYADYSQETLKVAVDLVKSKALSSYEAEKQFGIPRRTILNKCKNRHDKAIGRPLELSAEEEGHIAEVIEVAADFGSPLTIMDLRIVVYNYLEKCGKTELFKGRMPGERWARNFLERHSFTQRATQNIKRSRASKTVEELTSFYENLGSSLKDVPCENILNFDETNLSDDPGLTKAIFKRGTKHPERVLNSSKSSVSIMFSGTADGQCLPPYVVYKAEHLWSRWCELGPPNARYNRTKSGWFDMVCFDDWFKTIILPWAKSREGLKVVIGDNLASHLSVEVVKLCQENNIRLVFLPPNATHLTQPLDVAFFGPMKRCWREILLNYKLTHQNSTTINKCDFPQLLQKLMTKINMTKISNIRSGFAGSGIFPFNPSRVLTKIPVVLNEETKNFDVCLLEYLKKIRNSTTQSKKESNKKLAVTAGKSISTEEAEKMKKGKGKGKTTKKCTVPQQPKSLKELSIKIVNKFLPHEDKTLNSNLINMARKKTTTKKKTQTSNVRFLSQVSKTDNENLPFMALYKENLPKSLQTTKTIYCGSENPSKSGKNLGIKVLSEVIINPGPSYTTVYKAKDLSRSLQTPETIDCDSGSVPDLAKKSQILTDMLIMARSSNTFGNAHADLKNQHARSENLNIKRKRVILAGDRSVLQKIPIPKSEENVVKFKKVKQQKYITKNASRYSGSTTSVSDDMSVHTDSSIIDFYPESDGADSEDFPLYCFTKSKLQGIFNSNSDADIPDLNDLDDQISDDVLSEINCHALSATNFPRTAARRRVNVLSSPISQRTDVTKSDNTDLSDSKMSQNQCEPNFSQDQSEISTQDESCLMISTWNNSKTVSFHHISEPNQPVNSESQASCPPISEDSIFNIIKSDDAVSDKILSPSNSDDEQTSFDYSVNDKVLVRYYTKNKKWKYYIGVITACNIDQTFDISFYIMTRNKGELIFKKPKKVDRDTVPKMLIEKIIKIDKISDKPKEYKIHEQEDATYF